MTDYTVIESPNYRVRIINDPYAGDPWIDDEVWHLASWSSRIPGENHNWDTPAEFAQDMQDTAIYFPIYAYVHSGIVLSTSPFSDPWDSSHIGYAYITREKITEIWDWEKITRQRREKLLEDLKQSLNVLNAWLNGECFGFILEKKTRCNLNEIHYEEVDSCWGFYGDDPRENGMTCYWPDELKKEAI